jgi:hypothetical protein
MSNAKLWAVSLAALLGFVVLLVRCEPATPPGPVDAPPDAGAQDAAEPRPDMGAALSIECLPCAWTAPYQNCTPSLCAERPSGQLCCVGVS